MVFHRRTQVALGCCLALMGIGTLGYHLLEKWDLLDSLYMTTITLTTVGYGEVHPIQKTETRVFTMVLILSGLGVVFYTLGVLAQSLVEGEIREFMERKKVRKVIQSLSNHCIICGFGRIGQSIADELSRGKMPFVVVEKDPKNYQRILEKGYLAVEGDATSEATLLQAGVERARALISVASTDADNLYITLTARGLNSSLTIIARAAEEGAERKLLWAGATSVVSPYKMSGQRMANLLLRPAVVEFIESSLSDPSVDLVMEEVHVPENSHLEGLDLVSSGLRKEFGLIIIAIKRKQGELLVNPSPQERLRGGDILIAIGERERFKALSSKLGH